MHVRSDHAPISVQLGLPYKPVSVPVSGLPITKSPPQRLGNGEKSKSSCFPGHADVILSSGESIKMRDVQVGDFIKHADCNANSCFSEVTGFLHRSPESGPIEYIKMNLDDGSSLEISPNHRVFKANHEDVFAADIHAGDMLAGNRVVTSINKTVHNSYFAPLTTKGTIFVNGVVASCYADVPHAIAHFILSGPLKVYNLFASSIASSSSQVQTVSVADVNVLSN